MFNLNTKPYFLPNFENFMISFIILNITYWYYLIEIYFHVKYTLFAVIFMDKILCVDKINRCQLRSKK